MVFIAQFATVIYYCTYRTLIGTLPASQVVDFIGAVALQQKRLRRPSIAVQTGSTAQDGPRPSTQRAQGQVLGAFQAFKDQSPV